jgi:hypothetical protein
VSQAVQAAVWTTAIISGIAALSWFLRTLWRGFSKIVRFADDALGDAATGQPGIIERMASTDTRLVAIEQRLGILDNIKTTVESLDGRVTLNESRLAAIEARFQVADPHPPEVTSRAL